MSDFVIRSGKEWPQTIPTGDSALPILDEGLLVHNAKELNFTGGGVTASVDPINPDQVNVSIPGENTIFVRAASTTNLALTGVPAPQDGVTLVAGNRIALINQTDPTQGGVWVISAGAWSRPADFAVGTNASGTMLFVQEGTSFGGTLWQFATPGVSVLVGTGAMHFSHVLADVVNMPASSPVTIVNGDFETGNLTGWALSQSGANTIPAISSAFKHSGTYSAFIGNAGAGNISGYSRMTQNVVLPSLSAGELLTLSYWYLPNTTDAIVYDQQSVYVYDAAGVTLLATVMNVCVTSASWINQTYNLTPFAGQTVQLRFQCYEDSSLQTYYFLDDVTILRSSPPPVVRVRTTLQVDNGINAGGKVISSVDTPSMSTDAATKGYVDAVLPPAATTLPSAVTLSAAVGSITSSYARPDHTHNLSTVISPTWFGSHIFNGTTTTIGASTANSVAINSQITTSLTHSTGGNFVIGFVPNVSGSGVTAGTIRLRAQSGADSNGISSSTEGGIALVDGGPGGAGSGAAAPSNGGSVSLSGGSAGSGSTSGVATGGSINLLPGGASGNPSSGNAGSGGSILGTAANGGTINGGTGTPGFAGEIVFTGGQGGGYFGAASAVAPKVGGKIWLTAGIGGSANASTSSPGAVGGEFMSMAGTGGAAAGSNNPGAGGDNLWRAGAAGTGGTGNAAGGNCVAEPGAASGSGTLGEIKLGLTRGTIRMGGTGRRVEIIPPLTVAYGATLPSAATIVPTAAIHAVSGTSVVSTITPPYTGFIGTVTLIPTGLWSWDMLGNIATAGSASVGQPIPFTFNGTSWYPLNSGAVTFPAVNAALAVADAQININGQSFGEVQDIILKKELAHTIYVATSTTADTSGGNLTVRPGIGAATNSAGGHLLLRAAQGQGSGVNGQVYIGDDVNTSVVNVGYGNTSGDNDTGPASDVIIAGALNQHALFFKSDGGGGAAGYRTIAIKKSTDPTIGTNSLWVMGQPGTNGTLGLDGLGAGGTRIGGNAGGDAGGPGSYAGNGGSVQLVGGNAGVGGANFYFNGVGGSVILQGGIGTDGTATGNPGISGTVNISGANAPATHPSNVWQYYGGLVSLTGGVGGAASSTIPGSKGGDVTAIAGIGGAGNTLQAAGDGAVIQLGGGASGTNNGGGPGTPGGASLATREGGVADLVHPPTAGGYTAMQTGTGGQGSTVFAGAPGGHLYHYAGAGGPDGGAGPGGGGYIDIQGGAGNQSRYAGAVGGVGGACYLTSGAGGGGGIYTLGSVTIDDYTLITNNQWFTLDDTVDTPVTFEFKVDGGFVPTGGRAVIDISASLSNNEAAEAVRTAITLVNNTSVPSYMPIYAWENWVPAASVSKTNVVKLQNGQLHTPGSAIGIDPGATGFSRVDFAIPAGADGGIGGEVHLYAGTGGDGNPVSASGVGGSVYILSGSAGNPYGGPGARGGRLYLRAGHGYTASGVSGGDTEIDGGVPAGVSTIGGSVLIGRSYAENVYIGRSTKPITVYGPLVINETVNTDLTFLKEGARTISVAASTTTDTNGAFLLVKGADGAATNSNGGALYLRAGAKAGSGLDGEVIIGDANTRMVTLGAASTVLNLSGKVGSDITFMADNGGSTISLLNNTAGNGDSLTLQAASATAGTANGGDIILNPGLQFGGGTNGVVSINSAVNMNSHVISSVTDPVSAQDAATKNWTETNFATATAAAIVANDVQEQPGSGDTTPTVIATHMPTASGNYLVGIYYRVTGGGSDVTLDVDFADVGGAQTINALPLTAQVAGSYTVIPVFINAVSGTNITVTLTAGTAANVAASASIVKLSAVLA